jgi:hypothetical protein
MAPLISAIALASLIILISTSFTKVNKILFQAALFGAALAGSLAYLVANHDTNLLAFWDQFVALKIETRFCLSVIVIGVVYFGGAMYVASPDELEAPAVTASKENGASVTAGLLLTPASCDQSVTFEVPADAPAEDSVFFEQMLDK